MREIQDPARLADMWTTWMHQWIRSDGELTEDQRRKSTAAKTSLFNVWVHQNIGGKQFVMAVWQTGITWAPPPRLLETDYTGALEHVAKHFASWTRRLARAVTRHKRDWRTIEARIRSGNAFGRHGLTPQQNGQARQSSNIAAWLFRYSPICLCFIVVSEVHEIMTGKAYQTSNK